MARIKGIGILSVVKALRIQRKKALRLLPATLHDYLDRQVSIDDWYPETDGFELLRALARLAPATDVWEAFGRQRAEIDLVEISPSPIDRGDPWGTLQRIDLVWRTYHDNGRCVVERLGPRQARVELHDYLFNGDDFSRLLCGYVGRVLRIAGARAVDVRILECGDSDRPAALLAAWEGPARRPRTIC